MFRFGFRRRRSPITYHVSSPDGSTLTFELESRATGQELLTRTLEETQATRDHDYFGLASYEGSYVKWIIVNRQLRKQLSGKGPFHLHLRVQVYPLDYHSLEQPASRLLLTMQLRRDLLEDRLTCEEDKIVWILGLAVQAELGDYDNSIYVGDYLSQVELMPRLTSSLEQQIHLQHKMNRGKPPTACHEELLGGAQLEAAYGIITYQVQDASRNPVTMTAAPSGVRVLRGLMATNHYLWHTIIKISHKGRRLSFNISSEHLATGHTRFTCSSSAMAGNMVYHLSRLRDNYTSTHTQRPSHLQRFFSSRRSVRVLKPISRLRNAPSSNPIQRRSFAGEAVDPTLLFNHSSEATILSRPQRSSLTLPSSPRDLCTLEPDERRVHHTHSGSYSSSRHSAVVESHSRQESRHSQGLAEPLSPDHHRQGSVLSQTSHHSSPSRISRDVISTKPPVTHNHHGNNYNQDIHVTPIRANLIGKEWVGQSPRGLPWENGVQSSVEGGPDFIPEEEGVQQLYPSACHRHHSMRSTPPRLHILPVIQPEVHVEPTKSSTFPREGSLSQPDGNTESVVDLLDEALEVLDEEEDQRKERERQRAMKPWKPQHRGRFRLSLQDSSYYDHRLYNSYRHFNRSRAFHGSTQQSSSTTHLNTTNDPMVASTQLQESLVELSQASDTAIDPHIRSFVFEGSRIETGGATEL